MKITLLTAASLATLLALSGCAEGSSTASGTPTVSPTPTATATSTSSSGLLTSVSTTLSSYYNLVEETTLRTLVANAGLTSQIPKGTEDSWYRGAAANCDAVKAGHPAPLEGVWAELDNLALKAYCPELVPLL